jgi:hypothetical protein
MQALTTLVLSFLSTPRAVAAATAVALVASLVLGADGVDAKPIIAGGR